MARRYVILTAAVMLAVAIAVPAIGENAEPVAVSSKASKKAKRALKQARKARKRAKKAKQKAREANQAAKQANQLAQQIQQDLASTRIVSDTEAGTVTSTDPIGSYEARGGPSVQVTVPSSGLVEVWAQAEIRDDEGGAVGLYEDGQKVPNVSDEGLCGDDSALIDMQGGGTGEFDTFASPPTPGLLGCTNAGAAASVILQRPPGTHTYELRYSECSCGGSAEFRNRVLRVAPRL